MRKQCDLPASRGHMKQRRLQLIIDAKKSRQKTCTNWLSKEKQTPTIVGIEILELSSVLEFNEYTPSQCKFSSQETHS